MVKMKTLVMERLNLESCDKAEYECRGAKRDENTLLNDSNRRCLSRKLHYRVAVKLIRLKTQRRKDSAATFQAVIPRKARS